MKPWQKLIIIVIVLIFVVGCILGGLYIGFKYGPKPVVAKEVVVKVVVKEEVKEKAPIEAEETTAPVETAIETTVKEEEIAETVVETSAELPFIPEGTIPAYTDSKDGVPENGTELHSDVGYDEIWCATFGPGKFLGVVFPGGVKRGTVVIQLGPTEVGGDKVHYVITDLIPGASWQGNWHYNQRLVTEKDWMAVKDLKVKEMMGPDNATDSQGCDVVDVVVAQAGKIIFQETYQRQ